MTDEADDDDEDDGIDVDYYDPLPVTLSEGDLNVPDPTAFCELFNAHAFMNRGFDLWVLDRDSLKWVKVEPKAPEVKRGNLKTVN